MSIKSVTIIAEFACLQNPLPILLAVYYLRIIRVRAKMRIEVRKLLAKYGYPPDLQRAAVNLIIRQAENLAARWF